MKFTYFVMILQQLSGEEKTASVLRRDFIDLFYVPVDDTTINHEKHQKLYLAKQPKPYFWLQKKIFFFCFCCGSA